MHLVPSTLQNSDLPAAAKRCIQSIQHRLSDAYAGIDGINLSGLKGDNFFGIIAPEGVLLISCKDPNFLASNASFNFLAIMYQNAVKNFSSRLHSHSVLKDSSNLIKFSTSIVFLFPDTMIDEVSPDIVNLTFFKDHCRTKEWLNELRNPQNTGDLLAKELAFPMEEISVESILINESMRDVIINRIAPWATIPKITQEEIDKKKRLAASLTKLSDISLLHTDSLVDVLRLDKRQIDEVNAIRKGHQLILACAGSGKSVILIAKCFKLASLDKNRQFILLCYNKNLRDYYLWQIDEAGFSERNVQCMTIHQLFSHLIDEYHIPRPAGHLEGDAYYDAVAERVLYGIKSGVIKTRYYGLFIDEVQIFKPLWYRICCMLLEDQDGNEHLLAICGDLTQNLKKNVKHGEAPWQGEGLPIFRGHTIHIETNYRNSIQINDFVNIYAGLVRKRMPTGNELSTDTYLRGKAFRNGFPPIVSCFSTKKAEDEAKQIIKAIRYMHDEQNIGYSEIAVLLYNRSGNSKLNYKYSLLPKVKNQFFTVASDIPFITLSWSDERRPYVLRDGVSIITYEGALGIDYRGIVVAGVSLIGTLAEVQYETPESISAKPNMIEDYRMGFDALYLACTRAKDSLAIILPSNDSPISTIYSAILHECISEYKQTKGEVIEL